MTASERRVPDTLTCERVTLRRVIGPSLLTWSGSVGGVGLHVKETRLDDERQRFSGWLSVYANGQGGPVPEHAAGATPEECVEGLAVIVRRWRDAFAALPREGA